MIKYNYSNIPKLLIYTCCITVFGGKKNQRVKKYFQAYSSEKDRPRHFVGLNFFCLTSVSRLEKTTIAAFVYDFSKLNSFKYHRLFSEAGVISRRSVYRPPRPNGVVQIIYEYLTPMANNLVFDVTIKFAW